MRTDIQQLLEALPKAAQGEMQQDMCGQWCPCHMIPGSLKLSAASITHKLGTSSRDGESSDPEDSEQQAGAAAGSAGVSSADVCQAAGVLASLAAQLMSGRHSHEALEAVTHCFIWWVENIGLEKYSFGRRVWTPCTFTWAAVLTGPALQDG